MAGGASAEYGTQARRGLEQARGLALDHRQVGGFGEVGVAGVHELQHLAFGDRVGGVGEDVEDAHLLQRDHELECAGVEEVAHQHRRGVAELRIGGRVAAAQVGFVDDVVVQQRGGMDHLDDGGQRVLVGPAVAGGACREEQQRGPQALAAAGDDVFGDLSDQHDVGVERGAQDAVDGRHVGADHGLEEVDGHWKRGLETFGSGGTGRGEDVVASGRGPGWYGARRPRDGRKPGFDAGLPGTSDESGTILPDALRRAPGQGTGGTPGNTLPGVPARALTRGLIAPYNSRLFRFPRGFLARLVGNGSGVSDAQAPRREATIYAESLMYAVIKTGGKQYKVAPGEKLKVEQIPADVGAEVILDQVLMVGEGESVRLGQPTVAGATVTATVVSHGRGEKVKIFKMRRRKHYQKHQGHRQNYTELKIEAIVG